MSPAMNEKNRSGRGPERLSTAIERGATIPRRPENLKLLCQPLRCHLIGLIAKIDRRTDASHQATIDKAKFLLSTLERIDREGVTHERL